MEFRQPIETGVLFKQGKVRPVWFRYSGRKIMIAQVTMTWASAQGSAQLTHFVVSDNLNLYTLTLNHQDLTWRLTQAGEVAGETDE